MSIPSLRLLPLLAALTGCVDFVDPSGLRLAEDTRISVSLGISDAPAARCTADPEGPVARPPGSATLCLDGTLRLGRDETGERDQIASDTLWAMGQPVLPELDEDSVYRYRAAFRLPVSALEDTVYTLRFPRVVEVPTDLPHFRWVAVAPVPPDTILRTPGEGVVLQLALPPRTSTPAPTGSPQWQMLVQGQSAVAQYNGAGTPRPSYPFPASVLEGLGGDRFTPRFSWRQIYSRGLGDERMHLFVDLTESLMWSIRTVPPPEPKP